MQLHANPASPFVRKVRVVAIETGLDARIEQTSRLANPVQPLAELTRDNPLGKIPCLITDDGAALYDSRVICEYLDGLHDGPKLFPAGGPERFSALRRQALGDGIMDAGVLVRYETWFRPEAQRWPAWIEQQKQKFRRALDLLEGEAESLDGTSTSARSRWAARSATSTSATPTMVGARPGPASPRGSRRSRGGRR